MESRSAVVQFFLVAAGRAVISHSKNGIEVKSRNYRSLLLMLGWWRSQQTGFDHKLHRNIFAKGKRRHHFSAGPRHVNQLKKPELPPITAPGQTEHFFCAGFSRADKARKEAPPGRPRIIGDALAESSSRWSDFEWKIPSAGRRRRQQ
jgi:hypothetical protein